jgi:Na+/H+ antiporter NhaD/arsenite permease-like protein
MNRIQLFRLLRHNNNLSYRRSPAFEQGMVAKVLMGIGAGLLSSLVDTFTIAISNISLYQVGMGDVAVNGVFWSVIAYTTAVGGCLLSVGSISGIALMKMEHVRLGWYVKHLTPKVLLGWIIGFVVLWIEFYLTNL